MILIRASLTLHQARPARPRPAVRPQDVARFRAEYERSGPMVKGIPPREAVERLKRASAEERATPWTGTQLRHGSGLATGPGQGWLKSGRVWGPGPWTVGRPTGPCQRMVRRV